MEYNGFNQYGRDGQEPEGASSTDWEAQGQADGAAAGETAGHEALEQGTETV